MKTVNVNIAKRMYLLVAAMLLVTAPMFANPANRNDKVVEKARQFVNEATPDNWLAYAEAAKMCIEKKVNLKEADEWLKRSLEIKETAYNTKIRGDYYAMSNLPQKAIEYYSLSIRIGKLDNSQYQDQDAQDKILALIKQNEIRF